MIDQRKMMYPKGHVIHYANDIPGFQKVKTLCGRITNFDYWSMHLNDWAGMTRYCHNCLKVRFDD